jgi:hypothetical protein
VEGLLIIQTAIFGSTLFLLLRQNRNLKRSLDLLAYQDVTNRIQKLDKLILEKPELGMLLPKDYSESDEVEIKTISFTYMTINFFEMLFILKEKRIIDEEIWKPWENSIICCFSSSPTFQRIWESKVNRYQMYYKPFRDFVNENVEFGLVDTENRNFSI